MKVEIFYSPIFHIVIRDMFSTKENKEILKEALSLEDKFLDSYLESGKIDKKFRSNRTAMYDTVYAGRRKESVLLRSIDKIFQNQQIHEIMGSSEYPFTEISNTNTHETQVSRYGDDQFYKWHVVAIGGTSRMLTFVYYFNETPKKFSGGELEISNTPIYHGELVQDGEVKKIEIENNMMIIFDSHKAHRVLPTKSPKTFKQGRFSVNCWVGKR